MLPESLHQGTMVVTSIQTGLGAFLIDVIKGVSVLLLGGWCWAVAVDRSDRSRGRTCG